ncbi:MAG: LLM class flavin-dependent oxidoreductase [Porticoccaceae bacterium]|nr:LLM class flavin-dependent oxidoreductase [Porticoccaceae bacterium]
MIKERIPRLGISMPGLNQPIHKFAELAQLAEQGGFDSVWAYEFYRNAFIMQSQAALTTKNIQLCIGLAASSQRTPFEMANAAADVDELSGGRLRVVVGTGGGNFAEYYNGTDIDRPASRVKEYIHIMRLYWQHLRTGEQMEYQGEFYRFATPPINPFGSRPLARPEIPLYIGALRPAMLRLAGAQASGAMGFFMTPNFIEKHMFPHIDEGAVKAGRDPAEIDLANYLICSVSDDREVAMRRARIQVGCYAAYPVSTFIADEEGLAEDRNAVVKALLEKGPQALEHATSDALVERFSIAGTPDECREKLKEQQKVTPHVVLHTPYVPPLNAAESEDAYRNIVRTFARG